MYGLDPLTRQYTYSTPCGWCAKWDKKCDKKIGCEKSDESYKQLPIKNKISDTPKQEPHFPQSALVVDDI